MPGVCLVAFRSGCAVPGCRQKPWGQAGAGSANASPPSAPRPGSSLHELLQLHSVIRPLKAQSWISSRKGRVKEAYILKRRELSLDSHDAVIPPASEDICIPLTRQTLDHWGFGMPTWEEEGGSDSFPVSPHMPSSGAEQEWKSVLKGTVSRG